MKYYVAINIMEWSSFEAEPNMPIPFGGIKVPDGCAGFLMVYDSIEALKREHPEADYVVLTSREGEPDD